MDGGELCEEEEGLRRFKIGAILCLDLHFNTEERAVCRKSENYLECSALEMGIHSK